MNHPLLARRRAFHPAALWTSSVLCLAGCGGGSDAGADTTPATVTTGCATDAASEADVQAQPAFHMAPVELDEPAGVDGPGRGASAGPRRFTVDASARGVDTARLTPQSLGAQLKAGSGRARALASDSGIVGGVYAPAQIRAAYGLPELPASWTDLSPAQAADFGAGQTIYVVDAGGNPTALDDLNRFSAKFGLPPCAGGALPANAALPLAAAGPGCTFNVASTDAGAALKAAPPDYNAAWASEIALDVQWAHAIAPLARIVLIETSASYSAELLGGVKLANKMGPGVVSMSFGAPEGKWVRATDASFTAAGMSYVAAAGDAGAQVNWPAVSPGVLAVGGTSLSWNGNGPRREVAWSGSGGGVSAYEPLPSWQAGVTMPGRGVLGMRGVSDVAFNANPYTGQYVALTAPGSTATTWNAYGGTSIATPQWAGLLAVANARRAVNGLAMLGDVHAALYNDITTNAGTYAAAFSDIQDGDDGTCASCAATRDYDQPTGWGTPNAAALLDALVASSTSTPAAALPTVPGGVWTAQAGLSFSQALDVTLPSGITASYALSGAPAGMTVSSAGVATWASPVAGSYAFVATVTTATGKSASGRYAMCVLAAH